MSIGSYKKSIKLFLITFIALVPGWVLAQSATPPADGGCYEDEQFIIVFNGTGSNQNFMGQSQAMDAAAIEERMVEASIHEVEEDSNYAKKIIPGIRYVVPEDIEAFIQYEKPKLEAEGHTVTRNTVCPLNAPVSGNVRLRDIIGGQKRVITVNNGSKTISIVGDNGTKVIPLPPDFDVGIRNFTDEFNTHFDVGDYNYDGLEDLHFVESYDNHQRNVRLINNGLGGYDLAMTSQPTSGVINVYQTIIDLDLDGDDYSDSIYTLGIKSCDAVNGCSPFYQRKLIIESSRANMAQEFGLPLYGHLYFAGAADYNGDGKRDIGIQVRENHLIYEQINSGQFIPSLSSMTGAYDVWAEAYRTTTGDFNGDGKQDVVMGIAYNLFQPINSSSYSSLGFQYGFQALISQSNNQYIGYNYTQASVSGSSWYHQGLHDPIAADFNNDGKSDIVSMGLWLNYNSNPNSLIDFFPGTVTGLGARSQTLYPFYYLFKGDCEDMDFDGDVDCAYIHSGNTLLKFKNEFIESGSQAVSFTHNPAENRPIGLQPAILKIADPFGLNEVTLKLVSTTTGQTVASVRTDDDGDFYFPNVAPGTYKLKGQKGSSYFFDVLDPNFVVTVGANGAVVNQSMIYSVPPPKPGAWVFTNDPGVTNQWGLDHSGSWTTWANNAWIDYGTGSSNLITAVLDDGLDYTHPDIASNVWTNPGEIPNNNIDDDNNGVIDDVRGFNAVDGTGDPMATDGDHGTHVAGIIAAKRNNNIGVAGIAPTTKVLPIRVCGSAGCSMTSMLNGLAYAVSLKQRGVNIRVANMSLGGLRACTSPEQTLFQQLNTLGVVVAVAAGNEANNNDQQPVAPANCSSPNIITVAAVSSSSQAGLASFSNYGPQNVDVAAPGVGIWSLRANHGYMENNGTSMAAPFVAGISALLLSKEPNLTPAQVRQRIMSTIRYSSALVGKVGAPGIVNAWYALRNYTGAASPTPTPTPTPNPTSTPTPFPTATPTPSPTPELTATDLANLSLFHKNVDSLIKLIDRGVKNPVRRSRIAKRVERRAGVIRSNYQALSNAGRNHLENLAPLYYVFGKITFVIDYAKRLSLKSNPSDAEWNKLRHEAIKLNLG